MIYSNKNVSNDKIRNFKQSEFEQLLITMAKAISLFLSWYRNCHVYCSSRKGHLRNILVYARTWSPSDKKLVEVRYINISLINIKGLLTVAWVTRKIFINLPYQTSTTVAHYKRHVLVTSLTSPCSFYKLSYDVPSVAESMLPCNKTSGKRKQGHDGEVNKLTLT